MRADEITYVQCSRCFGTMYKMNQVAQVSSMRGGGAIVVEYRCNNCGISIQLTLEF